jgi:DNA-binding response OmpR family regulator
MSNRVIVVEDDPLMQIEIANVLQSAGFEVAVAGDGKGLDDCLVRQPASLVVLDINLPGEDGFAIARRMAVRANPGIVMLTARASREDRLTGLDQGADAYLNKPFDPEDLIATVRAVLRRIQTASPAAVPGWVFQPRQWRLVAPNGESVELTALETRIIEILLRTPGQPVSRYRIAAALDGRLAGGNELEALIYRLRRKISAACPGWNPVRTAHRIGYCFSADSGG